MLGSCHRCSYQQLSSGLRRHVDTNDGQHERVSWGASSFWGNPCRRHRRRRRRHSRHHRCRCRLDRKQDTFKAPRVWKFWRAGGGQGAGHLPQVLQRLWLRCSTGDSFGWKTSTSCNGEAGVNLQWEGCQEEVEWWWSHLLSVNDIVTSMWSI